MKTLANTFFKGLLFTLPILITFGLIYWLFATAENWLKIPLELLLPQGWYVTGMGVTCAFGLIFCIGLLVQAYIIKYLFKWIEQLLESIPLVRTLYSSAKDLMYFFAGGKEGQLSRVVKVTLENNLTLIGFVTNENVSLGGNDTSSPHHSDSPSDGLIAVYFPMSYQIGGYTAYMPKDRCQPLDIPVKKAMQQVLTANINR